MVVVVIVIVVFGFELVDDGWCLMRKHQMVDRCVFTTESILMIQQSKIGSLGVVGGAEASESVSESAIMVVLVVLLVIVLMRHDPRCRAVCFLPSVITTEVATPLDHSLLEE